MHKPAALLVLSLLAPSTSAQVATPPAPPPVQAETVAVPIAPETQTLTSPSGRLMLTFSLTPAGAPTYQALGCPGKPVIQPSALGLELKDQPGPRGVVPGDLARGFTRPRPTRRRRMRRGRRCGAR